jgi:hypothetical protein
MLIYNFVNNIKSCNIKTKYYGFHNASFRSWGLGNKSGGKLENRDPLKNRQTHKHKYTKIDTQRDTHI